MAKLRKRIADNVARGRQIIANALKRDAAAIRAKRAVDKARKIEDGIVGGCPVGGNRFGTQSPKEGWLKGGERGNGQWDPSRSGLSQDRVDKINSVTGGKPVAFKDGYPDYSDYTYKAKGADDHSRRPSISSGKAARRAQRIGSARRYPDFWQFMTAPRRICSPSIGWISERAYRRAGLRSLRTPAAT